MKVGLIISFWVLLITHYCFGDEQKFEDGIRMENDSAVALENAIRFIEAGFQRGEFANARRIFSDEYIENGVKFNRAAVLSKITEIYLKKESTNSQSNLTSNIYFHLVRREFTKGIAEAAVSVSIYKNDESEHNPIVFDSKLEFTRSGGGWILCSSDDLLKRIAAAFEKPIEKDPQDNTEELETLDSGVGQ